MSSSADSEFTWDIALVRDNQHIGFYKNGQIIEKSEMCPSEHLIYDPEGKAIFTIVKDKINTTIYRYDLTTKTTKKVGTNKSFLSIIGAAYDPISKNIFWGGRDDKDIFWKNTSEPTKKKQNEAPKRFGFNMGDDELPYAVAVDIYNRYLYWTNIHFQRPTIERARLDGTGREVIIDKDLTWPSTLAIDQQTKRLYWTENRVNFSIESSDLDGNNRETVVTGTRVTPMALAVSKEYLYWIDWCQNSVWRVPKTARENSHPQPEQVVAIDGTPHGLVACYPIDQQIAGVEYDALKRQLTDNTTRR